MTDFQKPPSLLLDHTKASAQLDFDLLQRQAGEIEKKFNELSVAGWIVHMSPGPVVTTYEFQPDAGVALKAIIRQDEDLCLALKATTIRIERLSDRTTVSIEVPNAQRETIAFREIIESDAFRQHRSPLALVLGKRIDGAPFVADLAQMPHLLIAGTTGSGKSVGLNSIIMSLLFRCTPEECRLVLIDPKRVELGLYADLPHLLTPVATEVQTAVNALQLAMREIEERYKLFAACSVRNILQFNKLIHDAADSPTDSTGASRIDSRLTRPLPHIVVVVDSLEAWTVRTENPLLECLVRIVRDGAAVGVHLVLAAQNLPAHHLSGLLRGDLAARVAFRTAEIEDSMTALGVKGAEKLLGAGDMLYHQPDTSQLFRLHGAYLSESEVGRVVKFLKQQIQPQHDESALQREYSAMESGAARMVDESDRELFEKVCEMAIQMGELSATLVQNRLRVGQARARRLVDYLDQMGLLGPIEAGRPRNVNVEKLLEVIRVW